MTKEKKYKQKIRDRMEETGERYTDAMRNHGESDPPDSRIDMLKELIESWAYGSRFSHRNTFRNELEVAASDLDSFRSKVLESGKFDSWDIFTSDKVFRSLLLTSDETCKSLLGGRITPVKVPSRDVILVRHGSSVPPDPEDVLRVVLDVGDYVYDPGELPPSRPGRLSEFGSFVDRASKCWRDGDDRGIEGWLLHHFPGTSVRSRKQKLVNLVMAVLNEDGDMVELDKLVNGQKCETEDRIDRIAESRPTPSEHTVEYEFPTVYRREFKSGIVDDRIECKILRVEEAYGVLGLEDPVTFREKARKRNEDDPRFPDYMIDRRTGKTTRTIVECLVKSQDMNRLYIVVPNKDIVDHVKGLIHEYAGILHVAGWANLHPDKIEVVGEPTAEITRSLWGVEDQDRIYQDTK